MSSQTGLLHQDLLILQQFRTGLSPEFDILDDREQVVGMVGGTESGARRFFLGPREFDVLDADGRRLAHVSDVREFWRDTYEIVRSDGSMLATVTRKLGFFSHRFSIALSTGEVFMVEGDFFGREFNMVNAADEKIVAQASRERAGFVKAFLGHHDRPGPDAGQGRQLRGQLQQHVSWTVTRPSPIGRLNASLSASLAPYP